ncbi:homing endonuclease [Xanthomonas phage CP1]|uniref:GIY-YIG domain-containing protein n=1 Tax=Xanthomonas phage CP1 TaxID=2994055 RepID=I7GYA4_9CAUD|nr:homing endonuclease [Xanthomonas phage CP1]BAM29102.1 hypothetical protein [Xanthomonas phage CP1]
METNLNQSGIYAVTSPSGKRYIGSAVNIGKRWSKHRSVLAKGKHHCVPLQRAHNKYGEALVYTVLILCSKEELITQEQLHMDMQPEGSLYNSSPTAGSSLGIRHSDETRARMAAASKGRTHSDEAKAKMSVGRLGRALRTNRSGFVGVSWHKRVQKWGANRHLCGKTIYLGYYPTAALAGQARQNFDCILRFYDTSWSDL